MSSLTVRRNKKMAKLKRLKKDIEKRNYFLKYLRERSLAALADKYNLCQSTIWAAEKTLVARLSHRQNAEIRTARKQYHATKKVMPEYSKRMIENRNNIATGSLAVKEEQIRKLGI